MGYETTVHLVDLLVKKSSIFEIQALIKTGNERLPDSVRHFLTCITIDEGGFLCFVPNETYYSSYEPDEEDETVPALSGKWKQIDAIVTWLKSRVEEDGLLIEHSCEGDGAAWGWEFNGKGQARKIALCPVEEWQ